MDRYRPDWAPEQIAELRRLWPTGLSTTEIGRRLGVSKNAVVGKAHRLELIARPSPIRPRRDGAPQRPRRPRQTPPTPLTPERLALIRRDCPTQRPVADLLAEAQALPGLPLTLSAVQGGAARMGVRRPPRERQAFPPRVVPLAELLNLPATPRPKAVPPPRPIATAGTATFGHVRTCQWIDGDVRAAWGFCGDAVVPGRSWCETHLRRVFVAVRVPAEGVAA